ncbi:hypothetical protein Q649_00542 [Bartonella quintana JK 73]|uniref:Uncharacterized protein n=2 Tax=Bartonella quintana TaxID=803 RepID=A0A0H3LTG8_BARQU|nr:hypothetical protein [Bartonella quintana]ETS13917.1 hypothetical protein Q650_00533 [Bartonella quintana JK 73rel]ETS15604.1 hypothetical protein Q649_00542 [Bartonella quintana JK 73]QUG72163.1 hypothetical protein FOL54_03805 [Bartonella quintana]CAF25752.1 hypothetical protein BQ02490 [Bartonella quintana str. Toulouse]
MLSKFWPYGKIWQHGLGDHKLGWVELSGAFKAGAIGRIKPKKGQKVIFTLEKVIKNVCFSDYAKLPFTRMTFDHEYIHFVVL